jgi:hypothetical protein
LQRQLDALERRLRRDRVTSPICASDAPCNRIDKISAVRRSLAMRSALVTLALRAINSPRLNEFFQPGCH